MKKYEGILLLSVEDVPGDRIGLVFGEGVAELGRVAPGSYESPMSLGEEYEEMIKEATEKALKRMCERAKELGANSIIGIRMALRGDSSTVHVLAWGTACKI